MTDTAGEAILLARTVILLADRETVATVPTALAAANQVVPITVIIDLEINLVTDLMIVCTITVDMNGLEVTVTTTVSVTPAAIVTIAAIVIIAVIVTTTAIVTTIVTMNMIYDETIAARIRATNIRIKVIKLKEAISWGKAVSRRKPTGAILSSMLISHAPTATRNFERTGR